MHWNRLSPIPKSSRWYQYIYMQTATYKKHPQTCFYKHNRYVNHTKITVHSIMSLKYMSPSSFHQFWCLLATCHRDLLMLFYTIAFFPQCMHHKLEYDRYLINVTASLAFVLGSHRDRWIPRTKGQLREKCFHLMTSSCIAWKWCRKLYLYAHMVEVSIMQGEEQSTNKKRRKELC